MASTMVGRTACPECGFGSAHVKRSDKCLYRYCPECGSQHHARTERQQADLMAKTRPVEAAPAPSPTPTPSEPTPRPKGLYSGDPNDPGVKPTPTDVLDAVMALPPSAPTPPEPKAKAEASTTPTPNPAPAAPKRRGLFS